MTKHIVTMYKNYYFVNKPTDDKNIYTLSQTLSENTLTGSEFDQVFSTDIDPYAMIDGELDVISTNFTSLPTIVMIDNKPHLELFHVTMDDYVEDILKNGLKPKIGALSKIIGEENKRIYMFTSIPDVQTALSTWMCDAYEEYCDDNDLDDIVLHLLKITIPVDEIPTYLEPSTVGYEAIAHTPIPPTYITYMSKE